MAAQYVIDNDERKMGGLTVREEKSVQPSFNRRKSETAK